MSERDAPQPHDHPSTGDGTRCVHAGLPEPTPGAPAAPYHLDPWQGPAAAPNGYGRPDNPTRRLLEAAIGELEGGDCRVFASGQAAITGLLLAVLRAGDVVVLPADGYFPVRAFATDTLAGNGVRVLFAPTAGPYPDLDGVRLVLVETPANPGLDVVDLPALAERAHAAGALLAVDNTTATPLGQRPLDLGADVVVASGTKALTGHSDLLLGYVATRSAELLSTVTAWRTATGAVPGAFDAWLAHRSLATLDLRTTRRTPVAVRTPRRTGGRSGATTPRPVSSGSPAGWRTPRPGRRRRGRAGRRGLMGASVFPVGYDALVARLRQAGCVWAEEEARLLLAVDGGPETLADLVDRRVAGEPLEYLLGWAEFCGERIEVDPGVFVPRARTALLVSTAVAVTGPAATVVELCCGSGAISRVLARRLAAPRLLAAVDVDPAAVACARRNLAAVGVPVLAGDLFDPLPAAWRGRLDLVVANAPYVPTVAMALLPPRLAATSPPRHSTVGRTGWPCCAGWPLPRRSGWRRAGIWWSRSARRRSSGSGRC